MAEISPLRRRMIEHMTVRNLSPATQQSYLNAISKFSRYFGRSPDRLSLEDVHAFLAGEPGRKASSKPDLLLSASIPPTDHRSGSGTKASNIYRATKPGLSANTAPQARRNTTSPIYLPRPTCAV